MQRSLASFAAIAVLASGCAFDDGESWANATFELQTEFDAAGRLREGRFQTSKDYEVELDSLFVTVGAMSLNAGAESAANFDPANPPEGYSLCHNGHCHADDGRLVDYADIQAELGGTTGIEVTAVFGDDLSPRDAQKAVGACPGDCEIPRGAITTASVVVRSVRLTGTAYDTRDNPRVPESGVPFDLDIPVESTLVVPLDETVGKDLNGPLVAAGKLTISARLLDALDFEGDLGTAPVREQLEEVSLWEADLIGD